MNVWTVPIAVIKPTTTSRNTTVTVADDPDLILPLAASSTYDIRMAVFYDGPATGTGDIKWTFTTPASATGQYMAVHQNISGATAGMYSLNWTDGPNINQTNANTNGTGTGNQFAIFFNGMIQVAGTAGNLTFRWAQNTSSGTNTRVFAQSYMVAQRIA